jgi:hypothetical protein
VKVVEVKPAAVPLVAADAVERVERWQRTAPPPAADYMLTAMAAHVSIVQPAQDGAGAKETDFGAISSEDVAEDSGNAGSEEVFSPKPSVSSSAIMSPLEAYSASVSTAGNYSNKENVSMKSYYNHMTSFQARQCPKEKTFA